MLAPTLSPPQTTAFESVLAAALDREATVPCVIVDPEIFFAEEPDGIEFAKSLCATCAVRSACLSAARERREPWGVWGGELFERGAVIAKKRPRGRPRKGADPDQRTTHELIELGDAVVSERESEKESEKEYCAA